MKTIGIVGGIGPESTVDYYRAIIIHDKYMGELVQGKFLPETREGLQAIVDQMKQRDGVILGGTELPQVIRDPTASGIPLLDTTQIHAKAIVARAWA
jgi:aspartate/glutamate racemase